MKNLYLQQISQLLNPNGREIPQMQYVIFLKLRASRYLNFFQDRLAEWVKFQSAFLDEALRHDGLSDFLGQTKCSKCGNTAGVIKCRDCASRGLLKCPDCSIALHQNLPLHRVEVSGHVFQSPDEIPSPNC